MRERNATFGVLITEVYPTGVTKLSQIDGVWVCKLNEALGIAMILREATILLFNARTSGENKGDKMQMLYDYLVSSEFRLQIESIISGFSAMQTDLNAEKRSMEAIWKKRQRQLEKVLLNTSQLFGSIKGIAGSALPNIEALQISENARID